MSRACLELVPYVCIEEGLPKWCCIGKGGEVRLGGSVGEMYVGWLRGICLKTYCEIRLNGFRYFWKDGSCGIPV